MTDFAYPETQEHVLRRLDDWPRKQNGDWNNMALTPVFPMVMQQIVTYLSGREFERPRSVGTP